MHLTGTTESDDFPTTPGAHDRVCNAFYEQYSCTNHSDAFALELSADGSQLRSSTFVGGAGTERGGDIAVDGSGRAYVTGASASAADSFPIVEAFQPQDRSQGDWCASRSDCSDAFYARFDAAKGAVLGSSFLGGRSHDMGLAIALQGTDAWIAGVTWSTDLPTSPGAAQAVAPGGNCDFFRLGLEFKPCTDAFVSRIGGPGAAAAPATTTTTRAARAAATAGGRASAGGHRLRRRASPPPASSPGQTGGTLPAPSGDARGQYAARRLRVTWRDGVLRGRLSAEARACVRRVRVILERRVRGRWAKVAAVRTARSGAFRIAAKRRAGRYRLRAPAVVRAALRCRGAARRVG